MDSVLAVMAAIPYGRENAISREDLCRTTGLSDRAMRKAIELARERGAFIINDQSNRGYFMTTDLDEISEQYWQDTARAMSILKRRKEMRRILKANGRAV